MRCQAVVGLGLVVGLPVFGKTVTVDVTPDEGLPSVVARVAELQRAAAVGDKIDVRLAPGEYRLTEPLRIVGDGTEEARTHVTYRSADRLHPAVVTGGRTVEGWQVGTDGVWRVTLPEVKAGRLDFAALFANGARRYRPRVPASGWYETLEPTRTSTNRIDRGARGFTYAGDVLDPSWSNSDDLEVFLLMRWNSARHRIADIDAANHEVVLKAPHPYLASHIEIGRAHV